MFVYVHHAELGDDSQAATTTGIDALECRDIASVIDELSRVGVARIFQRAYKSQGYDVFLSRLSPPFTVLVPSDQVTSVRRRWRLYIPPAVSAAKHILPFSKIFIITVMRCAQCCPGM